MKKLVVCLLLGLMLVSTASAQESTPTPTYTYYTVVQGDTLGRIAARFNTTTRAIMAVNNISNPDVIYRGMILRIPPNATPTPVVTLPPSPTPLQLVPSPTEAPPSLTQSVTPAPTQVIPPIGFETGGEVFSFDHVDVMHSAGMTWAKVQIQWSLGDPVNNARRAIEMAHRGDFKVLLQISGSPQEVMHNPATYIGSFSDYLGAVAALSPDAIEVWGDMNTEDGRISTSAYEQMLRAAFETIKRADSHILVISGALAEATDFGGQCSSAGCDNLSYLRGMAAAGVGNSADCIGLRYTLGAVQPEDTGGDPRGDQFLYYYPTLVSAYANLFPNKPLCFTEIGYRVLGSASNDSAAWAANTTPDLRAQWLAQAALLAQQSNRVLLFVVYNVNATGDSQADYAIVGADGSCAACQTLSAVTSTP